MKEFTLHTEVWLPRPRDEVFAFFADARNLDALTPPWVKFAMVTPVRYNSRLPLVVYVPKGVAVRYRIWHADPEAKPVPEG